MQQHSCNSDKCLVLSLIFTFDRNKTSESSNMSLLTSDSFCLIRPCVQYAKYKLINQGFKFDENLRTGFVQKYTCKEPNLVHVTLSHVDCKLSFLYNIYKSLILPLNFEIDFRRTCRFSQKESMGTRMGSCIMGHKYESL